MDMQDPGVSAVFDHPAFDDHEQVVFCSDAETGLRAIIAIHDTRLGPALGGCRMWAYGSSGEAVTDALRLSRGMTYKNSLAGLDLGGGKSVIIGDPGRDKTPALLAAFGRHVETLGGRYTTAEDVGISTEDMEQVATATSHARGTPATGLGDPSPYTALGILSGIKAALAHRTGSDEIAGRRIVLQGLGHVGWHLADLLAKEKARLVVADVDASTAERAEAAFGAERAEADSAHRIEADVFAPCALGAGLNARTIPELGAGIVAGAANNQLATEADGERLMARGVLYAPDYAINAGGVISIALSKPGGDDTAVMERVTAIGETLRQIFVRADADGLPTDVVADAIARERLERAGARADPLQTETV
ncbi:Glu/Leu/Phe/Val family dehydrogenase [Amorphus orientalis]|uniref:Leucine dehydrogenase n=1 Tax=Amorphus orientalis TaxID=649198 RepID=A0AAE3VSN3_9HYPH|nr:Glu/Leu/Phe/Val dehydrogenase dimerization domain-containing protein [Amorphus orientalis]MDQ0317238.1 leucine dehydrogenase [Amorphus orientalis]